MIRILKPAHSKHRRWLSEYLRKTPVGWCSIFLDHGARLYHARIRDLGRMLTIFNHGRRSKRRGEKKTVAEAAAIMIREKNHREKLTRYTAMLERGDPLEMVVTVIRTKQRYLIADGNHRSISAYRAGKRELDVHLIDLRYPRCRCGKDGR